MNEIPAQVDYLIREAQNARNSSSARATYVGRLQSIRDYIDKAILSIDPSLVSNEQRNRTPDRHTRRSSGR